MLSTKHLRLSNDIALTDSITLASSNTATYLGVISDQDLSLPHKTHFKSWLFPQWNTKIRKILSENNAATLVYVYPILIGLNQPTVVREESREKNEMIKLIFSIQEIH